MRGNKKREHRADVLRTRTAPADPKDREWVSERLEEQVVEAQAPRREESAMREEIARRAHEIYLARGGGEGRDVEDWLRAEAEVLASRSQGGNWRQEKEENFG